MSTIEHFFDLAGIIPEVVPFFWSISGFFVFLVCLATIRQTVRSKPISWSGLLPVATLVLAPICLLWIGARLVHLDETTNAPIFAEILILVVILGSGLIGFMGFRKLAIGHTLFAAIFALIFWLTVSTGFVADLSVCGDYARWIR